MRSYYNMCTAMVCHVFTGWQFIAIMALQVLNCSRFLPTPTVDQNIILSMYLSIMGSRFLSTTCLSLDLLSDKDCESVDRQEHSAQTCSTCTGAEARAKIKSDVRESEDIPHNNRFMVSNSNRPWKQAWPHVQQSHRLNTKPQPSTSTGVIEP